MKILTTAFLLAFNLFAFASELPEVVVYKSPHCGCCTEWVKHMTKAGFRVKQVNVEDTNAARTKLGMPERYGSCHTAKVGSYVIEGHVPADDIKRLLKTRPAALGLAAPGMPSGSPGMEGGKQEAYDVLLVEKGGQSQVFAKH